MLALISYQSTNNGNSTKDISYMKENCRIVKVRRSCTRMCGCAYIHIDIYIYICMYSRENLPQMYKLE